MARNTGVGGFDFSLLFSNLVLLVTLGLGAVAWLIAFIGQIAAEADSQRQGVLWFAIFLQLFLILGIAATLATDSIAVARLQLSAFLAVALVFAVEGINEGIYSNVSSLNAATAGWFILTIVDLIWLLFFTSDEDSALYALLTSFGNGRLGGPGGRATRAPVNRAANGSATNAYGGSSQPYGAAGMGVGSYGQSAGYQPTYGQAPSAADITQGGVGMPKSQSGAGSIRSGTPGMTMGGGMTSQGGPKSDISHGGDAAQASPASKQGGNTIESTTAGGEPMPGYGYRARALYAYTANADDPTEISFSKGEVLDIVDNSGKWWQARKANGETGIVPSNYMQVL